MLYLFNLLCSGSEPLFAKLALLQSNIKASRQQQNISFPKTIVYEYSMYVFPVQITAVLICLDYTELQ
jgi:hypothetical protein